MKDATDSFRDEATWLDASDDAALTAMEQIAERLDNPKTFSASLMTTWYKIYHDLRNRKVEELPEAKTEQQEFLEELGL